MAPKKAKRKPKRKGKKPIPKGQTGNGGGCPLNMVARAMERREKAYADGELLADGKATKDRDECCSYISTLLTCGLQACPAHNKAPHYHSFDVGEETGALAKRDTVVFVKIISSCMTSVGGANKGTRGFCKPRTAANQVGEILKALNPTKDVNGPSTIIGTVIENMMRPAQLGVEQVEDPKLQDTVKRAIMPAADYNQRLKKYRAGKTLLGLGVKDAEIEHPGSPPPPTKYEGDWNVTHCFAVYVDLVGHRCLVVDELRYEASPFKVKEAEGGAVSMCSMKCLKELLSQNLPVIEGDIAVGKAREAIRQNCRMIYGKMEETVCVESAFDVVYNFITCRADFDKQWEKAKDRAFTLK